jgi:hypothetical protein
MKFEKFYTENFLEKFQKNPGVTNFTRGTISQKEGTKRLPGPKEQSPHGQILWPRGACSLGPHGVLGEGAVPRIILSPENQHQVFFENFPVLHSVHSWISKFGADFSNLFGEITLWYVTPPPIQLLFVLMLYMLSILLHLVSLYMHKESMDLSFLVDIDA